jgi:hypothetical protein
MAAPKHQYRDDVLLEAGSRSNIPKSTKVLPFYKGSATRVTNGRDFLPGIDKRSYWAKRARELLAIHVSDLGGAEACTEAEKSIVRRAAVLTIELERLEKRFAVATDVSHPDLDMYGRLSTKLLQLLMAVGLSRRSRDVTPTIDQYLIEAEERAAAALDREAAIEAEVIEREILAEAAE